MSRPSRQSAGTVSLFPFLAVLVCAMGALILLLLVTTRRIRQRSLAERAAVEAPELPEPPLATLPTPAPVPQIAPDTPSEPVEVEAADTPILPLLADDPPPPPLPDPADALRSELAKLRSEQRDLDATVDQLRQALANTESDATAKSAVLASLQEESTTLTAEKERLNQLYARLLDQQDAAEQRTEDLQEEIEHARAQLAEADSKFAVVPYDGASGTTRRPIIIECKEDSLSFVSEGVSLQATDLDGFTSRFNPVLYASQALIRYWERKDRTNAGEELGEPYLLLIVRPGGTTSYYAARDFLGLFRQPFGYELVTDDQEFSWPESDLEACAVCRMIVEKMLAERDELYDVAIQQGATLPRYSDEQGRFRLEQVDRLRNPGREVTINGQRFARDVNDARSQIAGDPPDSGFGAARSSRPLPESSTADRFARQPTGAAAAERRTSGDDGRFAGSGVYTRQQAAVTRADRMPEWLRDGTTRLNPTEAALLPVPEQEPVGELGSERRSPGGLSDLERLDEASSKNATSLNEPSRRFFPQSTRLNPTDSDSRPSPKPAVDPIRPQWGTRSPGGTIGFEHEIRVSVSTTHVVVGDDTSFELTDRPSTDELRRLLAAAVDREVRNLGEPPRSFYWVPFIRFVVRPGASLPYQRLKNVVEGWGLRSSAAYTAE